MNKKLKKLAALEKELRVIEKKEEKLKKAAQKEDAIWKKSLEHKLPPKVFEGLKKAFYSAFTVIFEKGVSVIEKTYSAEELRENYQVLDYAVDVKGGRRELRKMKKDARKADVRNMFITTVEGVGLGALGIGIPDIVVFVGMLLKGIYETALHYGFPYDSFDERFLILKMMEASISKGRLWSERNDEIDEILNNFKLGSITEEMVKQQKKAAAEAFATDLLVLKFIQGLPIVGIAGGVANPIYYKKVMDYITVKYHKRYLINKKKDIESYTTGCM